MGDISDKTGDKTRASESALALHGRLLTDSSTGRTAALGKNESKSDFPSTVTWHRENGEPVTEKNEQITKLPVNPREGVDIERQRQLDSLAGNLLASHQGTNGVDFKGFGDIMQSIAKDPNLTEKEKVNVWDTIAHDVNEKKLPWSKEGANPFTLNNNRTWRIAHELISFDEAYHTNKVNNSDAYNGLSLILHDAGSTVEDIVGRVGLNSHNDMPNEIASRYQIQCLRNYLKNGFQGYADSWQKDFVSPLPQERNNYYYDKIGENTRLYGVPGLYDRNKVGDLLDQYTKEIKQRDSKAKGPEPISLYF